MPTSTAMFACVLAFAEKSWTLTNPPVTVVADASASVIPEASTSRSPVVLIVAPLLPTTVLTVGFDSARAVPVPTWTTPPPVVSSLLDVTALPSASTDSSRAPGPPPEARTLPSMLTVVQPPTEAQVSVGTVGSGPIAFAVGLTIWTLMMPPVVLDTRASAKFDDLATTLITPFMRGPERAQRRRRGDRRVDVGARDRVHVRVADRDRAAARDAGLRVRALRSGRSRAVGYGKL